MPDIEYLFEEDHRRVAAYMEGALIGEASYTPEGNTWSIDRTFVDERARGRGVAAALIENLVKEARGKGVKLRPLCSYAVAAFEKNPAYQALLSDV